MRYRARQPRQLLVERHRSSCAARTGSTDRRTRSSAATATARSADVSEAAGLRKARPAFGFTPLVLDYDNDRLARRLRRERFERLARCSTTTAHGRLQGRRRAGGRRAQRQTARAQAGMGVSAGDYDRDGWLDIVKTNFDDDTTSLYRQPRRRARSTTRRSPQGSACNTRYLGWGAGFVDVDLDGWPDIFIVNGHVYPEADRIGGRYRIEQPKLDRIAISATDGSRIVSMRAGPGVLAKKRPRGAAFGDLFNSRPAGRRRQQHARRAGVLLRNCAAPAGHSAGRCSWSARTRTAARSVRA